MLAGFSIALLFVAWVLTAIVARLSASRPNRSPAEQPFSRPVVGLMCATAGCLLLALALIAFESEPAAGPAPVQTAALKPADLPLERSTCEVFGFDEGKHALPANVDTTACLQQLASQLSDPTLKPEELVLTGHVDNQELKPQAVRIYGSNLSLAFKRAMAVRGWLEQRQASGAAPRHADVQSLAIVAAAGAANVGADVTKDERKADRRVEIRATFRKQPAPPPPAVQKPGWSARIGREFNVVPGLEADTTLAFLAFVVALSAYLASVRLSLRQLMAETETTTKDGVTTIVRKVDPKSTKVALVLISVADLPMIVAGLCIALYVFVFLPLFFLRWGVFLFAFAGGTMIILHAGEWGKSVKAIKEKQA